jgi:hypothetical protein
MDADFRTSQQQQKKEKHGFNELSFSSSAKKDLS